MRVSVVIPNHNRDISIIRKAIGRMVGVEILEINLGMERSAQRNIGIEQAKGKYILILDSDQVVNDALIHECVDIMEKPWWVGLEQEDIQALYIPEVIIGKDWFTKLRNFERQFYTGTCIDCVRFVRANNCPKFDETMSGPEDADWDLRIKGPRAITKTPLYHIDNITFKDYIKKKAYYSKSMDRFKKKHPQAKVLDIRYRCWGVFVEDGKWKKLLRHPIMTLKLAFLLLVRGIIYLRR